MQNTFSQSGNDSKWFLKKSFFKIGMWQSRPPRDPPPFMANAILNFHFDFLKPSLSTTRFHPKNAGSWIDNRVWWCGKIKMLMNKVWCFPQMILEMEGGPVGIDKKAGRAQTEISCQIFTVLPCSGHVSHTAWTHSKILLLGTNIQGGLYCN